MPPAPQITIDSHERPRLLTPGRSSISLLEQPPVEVISDRTE
jgi:hypothetical protein